MPRARLIDGVSAFMRAIRLALGARELWPWLLGPLALSVVAAAAGAGAGAWAALRWLGAGDRLHGFLLGVVTVLCALAAAYVTFLATASIAVTPFAPGIASRVEALDGGAPAGAGGGRGIVADLAESLALTLGYFAVLAVLAIAQLLVAPGAPLWIGLGVWVTARYLAFDALDAPLSRRGVSPRARWAYVRRHPRAMLGLGGAATAFALIPVVGLFAAPLAVVAATLYVRRAESASDMR